MINELGLVLQLNFLINFLSQVLVSVFSFVLSLFLFLSIGFLDRKQLVSNVQIMVFD